MNLPGTTPGPLPLTQRAQARPWPLWAMGAAVALTLAALGWQRLQGPPAAEPPAAASWQRSLHFQDAAHGDVVVLDAASGAEIARFQGEQGFLRGALRVLTRERARRGLGPQEPFVLAGHGSQRLSLSDPATGERIHLESFGPSNLAVFAPLRDARPLAPASLPRSTP